MNRSQIITVKIAQRELQRTRGLDDRWYREALYHAEKVDSCTKLSQAGFERLMGVFEGLGYRDDQQLAGRRPETYWRDKADLQGKYANERQVKLIHELLPQTKYKDGLAGLCGTFSSRRTEEVTKLRPQEAHNIIEMLKAVISRSTASGGRHDGDSGERSGGTGDVSNVAQRQLPGTADVHDDGRGGLGDLDAAQRLL